MATAAFQLNTSNAISGFAPTQIPGCILWLDGSDQSKFVLSGSNITRWDDKSSAGSNFTAFSNPTLTTINGLSAVNMGSAGYFQNTSYPFPATYSVFAVGFSPSNNYRGLVVCTTDVNFQLRAFDGEMLVFKGNGSTWGSNVGSNINSKALTVFEAINSTTTGPVEMYGNGVFYQINTGVTNTTTTGLNIGLWGSATWQGVVCEVILYNYGLTPYQRQVVEGYLAWKWGTQQFLPQNHLFRVNTLALNMSTGFQPPQISGCILWLDAADPAVFTGGTTWVDKSSSANNGINGTPGSSTMPSVTTWSNGLQAARFVATQKNSVKTTNNIPPTNVTYFMVTRVTQAPPTTGYFLINNIDGQRQFLTYSTSFPITLTSFAKNTDPLTFATTVSQNQGFIYTGTIPTSAGTFTAYLNGTSQGSKTVNDSSTSQNYFGSANGDSGYLTIDIAEIIIYNTVLSTTQQQQVEGYLAWKWGIQTSLPGAHPYRNNNTLLFASTSSRFPQPYIPMQLQTSTTGGFVPTQIANCEIWFDAADTSTITGTTQVTSFANKGSISVNMVNSTGYATSGSSTQNGLNYINIPSGVVLQFTCALSSSSNRTWFVVGRNLTQLTTSVPTSLWTFIAASVGGQDDFGISRTGTSAYELQNVPNAFGGNFLRCSLINNPFNSVNMYCAVRSTNTAQQVMTENGNTLTVLENNAAGNFSTASNPLYVSLANRLNSWDFFEMIFYPRTLTTVERQSVEGYLAWKWGIQSQLPANHPYKRLPNVYLLS